MGRSLSRLSIFYLTACETMQAALTRHLARRQNLLRCFGKTSPCDYRTWPMVCMV